MMALPKILKATHVKLQEETDMRVLAEETRDKLENEIKEVGTLYFFSFFLKSCAYNYIKYELLLCFDVNFNVIAMRKLSWKPIKKLFRAKTIRKKK